MPDEESSIGLMAPGNSGVRRALGLWVWSVLLIIDAVALTRRFSANFDVAIPESLAVISTALMALASQLAWILHIQDGRNASDSSVGRILPLGISLTITIGWFWAISYHATPTTIGLLTGVLLAHFMIALFSGSGSEAILAATPRIPSSEFESGIRAKVDCPVQHDVVISPVVLPQEHNPQVPVTESVSVVTQDSATDKESFTSESFDEEIEDPSSDEDANQTLWLSRRTAGELEVVEGWVRVSFASGQRETLVHVAFCPPLTGSPEIETEDLEGVGLEIRVAAAFPFGARISVRRSGSVEVSVETRVGFAAHAAAIPRAA